MGIVNKRSWHYQGTTYIQSKILKVFGNVGTLHQKKAPTTTTSKILKLFSQSTINVSS